MSEGRPVSRRYWKTPHWAALFEVMAADAIGREPCQEPQKAPVVRDLIAAGLIEREGESLKATRAGREAGFLVAEHVQESMSVDGFLDPDPDNEAALVPDWREFPSPEVIRAHAGRFASDLRYTRGDWMRRYRDSKGRPRTQRVALTVVGKTIVWETGSNYGEGPFEGESSLWAPMLSSGMYARWPDVTERELKTLLILHPGPPVGDGPTEVRLRLGADCRLTTFARLFEEMVQEHHDDWEVIGVRLRLTAKELTNLRNGVVDLSDDGWGRVFRLLWPFHSITKKLREGGL